MREVKRARRRIRIGIWRGSNSDQAAAARQLVAFHDVSLGVERYGVRRRFRLSKSDVDSLPAAVGFFHAEDRAGLAAASAAEFGEEANILIRLVEHQPAAASRLRRSDQFAVFGAPACLAHRVPAGEA